jgi:predicted transcriptional regulator of viral defense system
MNPNRLRRVIATTGADAMTDEREKAHSDLHDAFLRLASAAAAKRREMAAGLLLLVTTEDLEGVSPEEIREVMNEAMRHGWVTDNHNGTFTLTQAGRELLTDLHASKTARH